MVVFDVTLTRADDPDATLILGKLETYLHSLYAAEDESSTSTEEDSSSEAAAPLLLLEELMQANVRFLLARRADNALPLGCGALCLEADYAEIKKMFVLPNYRGRKIGQGLLAILEALAKQQGYQVICLEVGIHQAEAIQFYEGQGYQPRTRFGAYPDNPLRVFYEKHLH
jgi:putative acetyltransferase